VRDGGLTVPAGTAAHAIRVGEPAVSDEPASAVRPIAAELHIPAHGAHLTAARRYAREAARDYGLDDEEAYELEYAVNEAVTNAIQHGRPDQHGLIRLCALPERDRLTITVRDYGTFAAWRTPSTAPGAESGRGLALMARFVDEVHVDIEPGSTTVGLAKLRR
jgi:anti-sigma regulatory factor (Ser/Thr protein kinase)